MFLGFFLSRHFEGVSFETIDLREFWSIELDKYVKKIRRDFEQLYGKIYYEMTEHYNTKMIEIETDVKQAFHYQQIELEELAINRQMLQVQYDEVQASFVYEQKIFIEFEATYCKIRFNI